MSCAEREAELSLFVSEDLDEPTATQLRRHLDGCAGCRARLDEFRGGIDWLRSHRHAPGAGRLGIELQARLSREIAQRRQVPWPFTLVRQLLDALPRLQWRWRHDTFVGGLAALLLVVGAVGALQRPLDRADGPPESDRQTAGAPVAFDHHDDRVLEAEAEEATAAEGDAEPAASESEEAAEPTGELAALTAERGLRIELQTRDPDVRIIWFAGASAP